MAPRKYQPAPERIALKVVKNHRFKQVKETKAKHSLESLEYACTSIESVIEQDLTSRPRRELRITPPSDTKSIPFTYCGTVFDFAKWPGAIIRARGPQPGFENFENFLAQHNEDKCPPGCECREEDDCPCVRNKTVCDQACSCAKDCTRRFVGCGCRDACSSSCWCHSKHRQCGEHCSCTNCGNDLDANGIPRMRVQPSTIPGAGEGLFCLSKIKYKQYLGSYDGEKILHKTNKTSVVMDFRISKTECIRPDRNKSLLFKINYAQPHEANVQFLTFETATGRKVLAFAVTDVLPGTELLAWYGPECSDRTFSNTPVTKPPGQFPGQRFKSVIKENATGYEIHPLKPWQSFGSVLSWREFYVGQDVFVNYKKSSKPKDFPANISDARFIRYQLKRCWVARIADIKIAADKQAKVVVAWYDRSPHVPNDDALSLELIGLHQLDVIDGDSLSSPAEVIHVKPGAIIPKDKLYYHFIEAKERLDPTRKREVFLWAKSGRPANNPG